MSNQAKRFQPTKRHAIRVKLASSEYAAELARYTRNGATR